MINSLHIGEQGENRIRNHVMDHTDQNSKFIANHANRFFHQATAYQCSVDETVSTKQCQPRKSSNQDRDPEGNQYECQHPVSLSSNQMNHGIGNQIANHHATQCRDEAHSYCSPENLDQR